MLPNQVKQCLMGLSEELDIKLIIYLEGQK